MAINRRRTYVVDGGDDMKGILVSSSGYLYDMNTNTVIDMIEDSYGGRRYCVGKSIISTVMPNNVGVQMDNISSYLSNGTDLTTLSTYYYSSGWSLVNGSEYYTSAIYNVLTGAKNVLECAVYEDAMTGFKFTMISTFKNTSSSSYSTHVYQVNDSMCISSYIGSFTRSVNIYQAGSSSSYSSVDKMSVIGVYNGYAYLAGPSGNPSYPLYRYDYKTGTASKCSDTVFTKNGNKNLGGISIC